MGARFHRYNTMVVALGVCAFGAVARPASADDGDAVVDQLGDETDDYRDDARRLATEAAAQYQAANYEAALDLFQRAAKLYDAPTLRFWQARCMEKLGHLVEAEELYADVARAKFEGEAPEAFLKAQRDSEQALEDLRERLPTIKIIITRAKDISKVELDDRVLPPPLIGAPVAVNPGTHVVKVTRSSGAVRTESIAIGESQAQEVYVDFDAPEQEPLTPLMADDAAPESTRNWYRTTGWAALVVGGVGVGVGIAAGVRAMNKHEDLDDHCADNRCPPEYHSELESFRTWRSVSTVGYAVGVVGVAAGAVLLLTSSNEQATALRVSPTGASLSHHF